MKGIPDPPFRSFPEGPWVASGSRPPPSPTDFYDQDRLCPAVAGEMFDVGVSVSFSSSSFPCLPLSLKFGWIWQRREVHTASILDGPGAATPAVLVRTSHRHLGALPCWGREESVPQKNRGTGLMPAIRLGSGEGLSNLTLGDEHGPELCLGLLT